MNRGLKGVGKAVRVGPYIVKQVIYRAALAIVAALAMASSIAGTLAPCAGAADARLLEITFIDVGQGDSILIKSPDGRFMLIDAGEYKNVGAVMGALRDEGVARLDYIVATHPHSDHIGGLSKVIESVPVNAVYDIGRTHTTSSYRYYLEAVRKSPAKFYLARPGVTFKLGASVALSFLWPHDKMPSDLNDSSAMLLLGYLDFDALLPADTGIEQELEIVKAGRVPEVELYKVSHHGSRHSNSREMLAAASPKIAVIQVGAGNDYGYPQAAALDKIKAAGAQIFRTDKDGTVKVTSDGTNWWVSTENGRSLKGDTRGSIGADSQSALRTLVGSVNSTVFHFSGCESVAGISKANLVTYQDREEAIAKGKRPCKICNP